MIKQYKFRLLKEKQNYVEFWDCSNTVQTNVQFWMLTKKCWIDLNVEVNKCGDLTDNPDKMCLILKQKMLFWVLQQTKVSFQ